MKTNKTSELLKISVFESASLRCFRGANKEVKAIVKGVLNFIYNYKTFKNLDVDIVGGCESPGINPAGHTHLHRSIQSELPGFSFDSQHI
jgi:hypothetical protein